MHTLIKFYLAILLTVVSISSNLAFAKYEPLMPVAEYQKWSDDIKNTCDQPSDTIFPLIEDTIKAVKWGLEYTKKVNHSLSEKQSQTQQRLSIRYEISAFVYRGRLESARENKDCLLLQAMFFDTMNSNLEKKYDRNILPISMTAEWVKSLKYISINGVDEPIKSQANKKYQDLIAQYFKPVELTPQDKETSDLIDLARANLYFDMNELLKYEVEKPLMDEVSQILSQKSGKLCDPDSTPDFANSIRNRYKDYACSNRKMVSISVFQRKTEYDTFIKSVGDIFEKSSVPQK